MVNDPKTNLPPHPREKSGKPRKRRKRRHHQVNEGMSGLETERIRALGTLRSLQSKKKCSAEKRQETHLLNIKEKEPWIGDYVERETAVTRKRVQDAETVIMQKEEDMRHAEKVGSTTRMPKKLIDAMWNAIGDRLSDFGSLDDEEDGESVEADEEDTDLGNLSEDDEPGWVMGTISKTQQQHMGRVLQKKMRLDELTQTWWWDAADSFCGRDMKHRMAKLKVPAVVKVRTAQVAATPAPTTIVELMYTLDILLGRSQTPQVSSPPGISHIELGSEKQNWHEHVVTLPSYRAPDLSRIKKSHQVEYIIFFQCV